MSDQWVKKAAKHKVALQGYAKKMGKLKADGTVDTAWVNKLSEGNTIWAARARLAKLVGNLRD